MEVMSAILLLIAGFGAGIITGFIGASAVVFMAGFLILFLGYTPYAAIGLSLITDFFAALGGIYFYRKSKNLNLKHGILITIFATSFSLISGFFSKIIPHSILGNSFGFVILITGISFMMNPLRFKNKKILKYFENKKNIFSVLAGIAIGIFSGIFGVGGGITILLILIYVFDYPIKTAVGTSIFIMAFTALAGGIGHVAGTAISAEEIILTSLGGIIGGIISSKYANKIKEESLFKIIGGILIIISIAVILTGFKGM